MSIPTSKYLDEMEAGFQEAMATVRALIAQAEEPAIHLPEAAGKWSMLQCIKHMSLATEVYTKNVEEKFSNDELPPAQVAYKGHWKGRMFARMNAPKEGGAIPMKLKTFKTMEPADDLDTTEVMNEFFQIHEELVTLINKSRQINIDKVKVATALGPRVKLRIGEAYRFILAHTQRHVVQLERIKNTVLA